MTYVDIQSMSSEVRMDGMGEISVVALMFSPPPAGVTRFRVKMRVGATEWTCPDKFKSGKFSFVPDLSLLNAFPDSSTAEAEVIVYVENSVSGDSLSDSRTVLLVAFPEIAKPVLSSGWVELSPDNAASGYPEGVYVQGSMLKAVFNPSKVQFMYGAQERASAVKIGNASAEGDTVSVAIPTTGDVQVTCYMVDTRGFETKETFIITAHAYTQPVISRVTAVRCDGSGTENDNGAYIIVKADAGIANLPDKEGNNRNRIGSFTAELTHTGSTQIIADKELISGKPAIIGGSVVPARSYRVVIRLTDISGGTATYTAIIPTTAAAFNIKPGGKGAAFGRLAELDDALDIRQWDLLTRGILMGDVYMTTTEHDPAVLFGGTWTQNTDTGLPFHVWQREE